MNSPTSSPTLRARRLPERTPRVLGALILTVLLLAGAWLLPAGGDVSTEVLLPPIEATLERVDDPASTRAKDGSERTPEHPEDVRG